MLCFYSQIRRYFVYDFRRSTRGTSARKNVHHSEKQIFSSKKFRPRQENISSSFLFDIELKFFYLQTERERKKDGK